MALRQGEYEVHVRLDGRWTVRTVSGDKWKATGEAEKLLESKSFDAVRVLKVTGAAAGGYSEHVVWEKEGQTRPEPPVRITAVEEAPLCQEVDDLYSAESRKTVGRLLRQYLDKNFVTPTELLHSQSHLRLLQRQDTLLPQAVDRIAAIQARMTGEKPLDRSNRLHPLVDQAVSRAGEAEGARRFAACLDSEGLTGVVAGVNAEMPRDRCLFFIRCAIAIALARSASWAGKVDLMVSTGEEAPEGDAIPFLDEIVAEVLDGANGLKEILGSAGSLGGALESLVDFSRGEGRGNPGGMDLERLNAVLSRHDMPLLKNVAAERVARELAGTKPLTREGGGADMELFSRLMGKMVAADGLMGGSAVAEAAAKRAMLMVQGRGCEEEARERALESTLRMLDGPGTRTRYLVELLPTDYAAEVTGEMVYQLDSLLRSLKSPVLLAPKARRPRDVLAACTDVVRRIYEAPVPWVWRRRMIEALDEQVLEFIRRDSIIDRLDPTDKPLGVRTRRLLDLCTSGLLFEGRALDFVRDRVRERLRQPRFIEEYTAEIPPAEQDKAVRALHAQVDKAGIGKAPGPMGAVAGAA